MLRNLSPKTFALLRFRRQPRILRDNISVDNMADLFGVLDVDGGFGFRDLNLSAVDSTFYLLGFL